VTFRTLTSASLLLLLVGIALSQNLVIPSASFSREGTVQFPNGFRQWTHVGTRIKVGGTSILDGSPVTVPQVLNAYVEPSAFAVYKQTGKWPDGSQIVKELTEVKTGTGCDKTTFSCTNRFGSGLFEEKYLGVGMMIKDHKRFPNEPGNWAYFAFFYKGMAFTPTANKLSPDRCGACHVKLASDTDYVITDAHLGLSKIIGQ
jgi:Cytochrome P460